MTLSSRLSCISVTLSSNVKRLYCNVSCILKTCNSNLSTVNLNCTVCSTSNNLLYCSLCLSNSLRKLSSSSNSNLIISSRSAYIVIALCVNILARNLTSKFSLSSLNGSINLTTKNNCLVILSNSTFSNTYRKLTISTMYKSYTRISCSINTLNYLICSIELLCNLTFCIIYSANKSSKSFS